MEPTAYGVVHGRTLNLYSIASTTKGPGTDRCTDTDEAKTAAPGNAHDDES